MKIGDYVWFRMRDDVFCGNSYNRLFDLTPRPGKIMKEGRGLHPVTHNEYDIFWVTPIPIIPNSTSMPLWSIPIHLVKEMTQEEVVLALLENI